MITIDFSNFLPRKKYLRNNKECFLCSARHKLIVSTREELVRQATINFLIERIKIPKQFIFAEVPMSRYDIGLKGRADIIVKNEDDNDLILVECKEKEQSLTDDVFEQTNKYGNIVQPDYIMITNFYQTFFFAWDEIMGNYVELDSIPEYTDLLKKQKLNPLIEEIKEILRPVFTLPLPKKQIEEYIKESKIGEDTPKQLYPFLFNLYGGLFHSQNNINFKETPEFILVEDKGIRVAEFGNAGGGKWAGEYRYFIIKDHQQNNQVISLSIMGGMKTVNDPHWGNRKGHTYLLGAIDDFAKSHLSIVMNLDKFVEFNKSKTYLWHDGTMTVGKQGRANRLDVIGFIKIHAPQLIKDGRILLGVFDYLKEINIGQKNMDDFIENFISYLILRDKFRKSFNS